MSPNWNRLKNESERKKAQVSESLQCTVKISTMPEQRIIDDAIALHRRATNMGISIGKTIPEIKSMTKQQIEGLRLQLRTILGPIEKEVKS